MLHRMLRMTHYMLCTNHSILKAMSKPFIFATHIVASDDSYPFIFANVQNNTQEIDK